MGATENLSTQQFSTVSTSLNGSGANKPNGQSLNMATRRAPAPSEPASSGSGSGSGPASTSGSGNNTLPLRKVV
jgi:hypothetical protein